MYCCGRFFVPLLLLQATIRARFAAADGATVTLGAASGYSGTATPTATLTAVNIAFSSGSSDPNKGLDVFLSDQLASNVKNSVRKNCADQSNPDCQQSVQALLKARDVGLEARVFVVDDLALLAGAVVLFIGVVIPYLDSSGKTVPSAIHLGPADINQISSIGSATEIHVATATKGGPAFLVTEAPAPTTAAGPIPSISTVSAASGKLQAGDVVLTIPPDLVHRVSDFTGMTGHCVRGYKKGKRAGFDAGCLQTNTETFIMNAMPGRIFDNFFYMQGAMVQIGNTARADYIQALNNARDFAIGLAGQLHVDKKKAAALGTIAFALMYKIYVDGTTLTDQNVFQASEVTTPTGGSDGSGTITAAPSTTSASNCPSNAPKTDGDDPLCCQDKGCQGDGKKKTCATGDYRGCPCLNLVSYPAMDVYDTDLGNSQLSLFATIFAMSAAPSSTQISSIILSPVSSIAAATTPIATGLVNTCDGPSETGNDQCSIFCAPRSGVCVDHSGLSNTCQCQ